MSFIVSGDRPGYQPLEHRFLLRLQAISETEQMCKALHFHGLYGVISARNCFEGWFTITKPNSYHSFLGVQDQFIAPAVQLSRR